MRQEKHSEVRFTTILILLFIFAVPVSGQDQGSVDRYGLPIFPGVTGFGLSTKGGRGGKILKVTNLDRSGPGSFAEALQTPGRRIIVFEVAGIIDLDGESLIIREPFLTIAGQTAPDPGITLIKGGMRVAAHDVIIQHIRIRPGEAGRAKKSGWEVDGLATEGGAYDVVIDHVSTSWATDENLSSSGPRFEGDSLEEWRDATSHRITISHCIIAEGLSNSTHGKGEHSKGTLIHDNATDIAVIGNLYAHNNDRHPLVKGGACAVIANNLIYDPGKKIMSYALVEGEWGDHPRVTGVMVMVGNYVQCGPDSMKDLSFVTFRGPCEAYLDDNTALGVDGVVLPQISGECTLLDRIPFWPAGYTALPADQVQDYVLRTAGARPWARDEVDERIIREVKDGTGKIIDSEQEVGGYPSARPVYKPFDPEQWDLESMTWKGVR